MYCFGSHTRHKSVSGQRFRLVPNCLCTYQSSMYFGSEIINSKKKREREREKEEEERENLNYSFMIYSVGYFNIEVCRMIV